MTGWIAAQGYQLSPAKREIYWPAPENKSETSSLTEIQFPVARLRGAALGSVGTTQNTRRFLDENLVSPWCVSRWLE
jgi:hypothetical protein